MFFGKIFSPMNSEMRTKRKKKRTTFNVTRHSKWRWWISSNRKTNAKPTCKLGHDYPASFINLVDETRAVLEEFRCDLVVLKVHRGLLSLDVRDEGETVKIYCGLRRYVNFLCYNMLYSVLSILSGLGE